MFFSIQVIQNVEENVEYLLALMPVTENLIIEIKYQGVRNFILLPGRNSCSIFKIIFKF